MTNTDTADADGTAIQVAQLAHAGSQLVRVTVNTDEAAAAVPEMVRKVRGLGVDVPIIGDFHYNGHLLLTKYPEMAAALAKYRINPGNVGAKRHDEHFQTIVRAAIEHDKPVRIGVNWGSLDQALLTELMDINARSAEPRDARAVMIEAMIESALRSAELAEATGLGHDRIILSAKVSGVSDLVDVYRLLSPRSDYPLHLGLTEAGMGMKGIVASTAGLALLLTEGIGDTIRVSLTPEPGAGRELEVEVAQQILQSLGLRSFLPQVSACPGCGRTTSTFFQEMARDIQGYLKEQMPVWRAAYPGVEDLRVAVMGCVVNGPGRASTPTSGSACPARSRSRWRRSSSTVSSTAPCAATRSCPSSWPSSTRMLSAGSGWPRQRRRADAASPGDAGGEHNRRLEVHPSGCILCTTERPLHDVGDPHVSF